jgi:hypothetical protein
MVLLILDMSVLSLIGFAHAAAVVDDHILDGMFWQMSANLVADVCHLVRGEGQALSVVATVRNLAGWRGFGDS